MNQEKALQDLVNMEKEKRRFTILQKERAITDAQQAKNRSAIMAGVCILGAAATLYFGGQDLSQVLQHELSSIHSWEAMGQYLQDLGPLTTLLSAGAGAFCAKYLKNSRRLRKAQNDLVDFNNSMQNENVEELGGNENVRTR